MRMSVRVPIAVALMAALAALLAGCGDSSTEDASTTTRERATGPGDRTAVFQPALDALVEEGTITAEQEEAVLAAIAASRPQRPQGGAPPGASGQQRPGRGMMFSGALDELVDEGTLNSAQGEAVLDALSAALPARGGPPPGGAEGATTPSS